MTSPTALESRVAEIHGALAHWVESVPVREEHAGAVAWDGRVEVFELTGHPGGARLCYAWQAETDDGGTRTYAVLGVGPIDSPAAAVRAAIAADYRAGRKP